ncbi:bifunctional diaminohydroxyphosphoribosylaminopyrimidine deaminase/5-amino-6-(5-phosphoribosylamino)uracil reductase RibD [Rhodobacteraceae bacterium ASV31]|nr:bifunctional diaminohydroxyphosphoribosylaminopyrimidine deaminase/5-amino-6-(5-phosphoribosylamino)uracil reductase RibD [Anianabacter salinae]
MRHALALAARGLGRVWPNPAVGCVLIQGDRVVGRGWTQAGGRPHAEAVALAAAGDAARGATAYVTLEPCSHHGQTPPCASALAEAGVARVVVALGDPDSRVNGRGLEMLRDAGIKVLTGVLEDEARALQAGFLSRVSRGRPWVTLKLAASFDGRIATATGESRWITGPEARRLVHLERARNDAVLVGGGTARADDPALTVRGLGVAHQPVRVVWSRRLDLAGARALHATAREVPVWLCHGSGVDPDVRDHWQGAGARLIDVPTGGGRQIDPAAALAAMAEAGLTRVFCEGGGSLAASLLAAGLVDELVGFTAGVALGAEGQPSISALGVDRLAEAPRFRLVETRRAGGDAMHRWRAV